MFFDGTGGEWCSYCGATLNPQSKHLCEGLIANRAQRTEPPNTLPQGEQYLNADSVLPRRT